MWPTLLALLGKIPATAFSLFSGINVGSVFTGIGTALTAIVNNIVTYWKIWLIALLIAGNGIFLWEWRHTDAALVKEHAAHVADIASFKKAQADADNKAQTERALIQKESQADADQADANYSGLLTKYHASLVRYTQQAGKSISLQSTNYQLQTTQGGNGPSASTELPTAVTELPTTIEITGDDAQICAVNTARLVAVHDWAVGLKQEAAK